MDRLSDTAQILRGYQMDPKRVFASDINMALTLDVSILPGFGILPAGTVMGQLPSDHGRYGYWAPYAQENPDPADSTAPAWTAPFAYLLADYTNTATSVVLPLDESYKFAEGDLVAFADNDSVIGALAATGDIEITDITRNTSTKQATITFGATDLSAIDIAKKAAMFHQTTTATPWTKAVGFLLGGVDTGYGRNAKGAQGVVVLSHAKLYKGCLPNYDAEAKTDLSTVDTGQFVILK